MSQTINRILKKVLLFADLPDELLSDLAGKVEKQPLKRKAILSSCDSKDPFLAPLPGDLSHSTDHDHAAGSIHQHIFTNAACSDHLGFDPLCGYTTILQSGDQDRQHRGRLRCAASVNISAYIS